MSKKKQSSQYNHLPTLSSRAGDIPGIVKGTNGFSFSSHNLPCSDHFFSASDYLLDMDSENVFILFGQKSRFRKEADGDFRLAIEIVFTRELAMDFLYKAVFEVPCINSDKPFFDAIQNSYEVLSKNTKFHYGEVGNAPKDPSFSRTFSANYATASLSASQGLIEFFEASPDLIVNLITNNGSRPNMGVKSVVSVLAPASLLYHFFLDIKKLIGVKK